MTYKTAAQRTAYALCAVTLGYLGYALFSFVAEAANQSTNTPIIFRSMSDDSNIFLLVTSILMMLAGAIGVPAAFYGAFDKEQ